MRISNIQKDTMALGDCVLFAGTEPIVQGQILEINYADGLCKIIKDGTETISERIQWYPISDFPLPRREYKVINLTEYPDVITGENLLVAEMAQIKKTFMETETTVYCSDTFSLDDLDTFVLPIESRLANKIINNPEDNKIICHVLYFEEKNFMMDGKVIRASYLLPGY